jgi:uncharacterized caspase-like protein
VLAVGIGAYAHLPRLDFAAADARDLAHALCSQAGDGKLYRSAAVQLLTDEQATLPNLRKALATFTRDVQPGETLMLLLSGHGVKEGERFYFAPVELEPGKLAGTGLPWGEVLGALEQAREKARWIWVLADCCRAAPGLARDRQATSEDMLRDVEEGGNLVVCTASSAASSSYESQSLKHGLFTQAWLEALSGEVPPDHQFLYAEAARTRVLTLSGLQFLLDARVRRHAVQAGTRQEIQFPRLEGSFRPSQPVFIPIPAAGQ